MAQLDFFGLDEDFYSLMEFVFSETDMVVYESYSRIDMDIRQVKSVDDLRAMACERLAGGFSLCGWFPDVTDSPSFKTFKLNPDIGNHRTCLEGVGVMQFLQGVVDLGHLKFSSFSHWNEAGAIHRGVLGADRVNWPAMRHHSGRIHRHVRNNLAVAKAATASVLPGAYEALGQGLTIWYGKEYGLDSVELKKRPNNSFKPTPLRGVGKAS